MTDDHRTSQLVGAAQPDPLSFLDEVERTALVRAALGEDTARIISWAPQRMHGLGAGAQIHRISGAAHVGQHTRSWSLVVKAFNLDGAGLTAASSHPADWDYWKREWLAYQSQWLPQHHGSVVAPRRLGSGEMPGVAAWIAVEDLSAFDGRPWPLSRFGIVARHLGIFNGRHLTGHRLQIEPWMSTDWLRGWTEREDPSAKLTTAATDPTTAGIYSATMIKKLIELWAERATFFNALNSLPQTLCHRDVFPRNAFVRATPSGEQTVLIDWAFVGPGPVGADLTPLVEASLTWFEFDPEQADELEATCLEGYIEGLQTAGWAGSREEVEFGYLASLVLRSGLGAFAPIVTIACDPDLHGWIARAFGRPADAVFRNLRSTMAFLEPRIDQAQRLLAPRLHSADLGDGSHR